MATKRRNYDGYRPLDTSGNDYAGMAGMSDLDRAALDAATQSWDEAHAAGDQAGMDAAHRQAETIRNRYGYSGGSDGSQYLPFGAGKEEFSYESAPSYVSKYQEQIDRLTNSLLNRGEFTYDQPAPTYENQYQQQIGDLADSILNREEFSYNPETDPLYGQYQKAYTREGQRAAADAMGQYAAMTGGMPSTAAMAASQQAGNYYAAQMADKIPELYQLAYSMYQDEGDAMRANLDMLTALEQGDYNKYLNLLTQYNTDRDFAYGQYRDEILDTRNDLSALSALEQASYNQYLNALSQYNTDRNFAYNQYRDDVADNRYNLEWNYQAGRDQLSDQRYDDETAYNREQDAWERSQYEDETEYSRAMERAQLLAAAGDFSGYRALGYSDAEIATLQNAYARETAANQLASGGGSSGGRGAGGGSEDNAQNLGIYEQMYQNGVENEGDAYAWLLSSGYNTTQAGKLAEYYAGWLSDNSSSMNEDYFRSFAQSVAAQLASGRTDSVLDNIDTRWAELSPRQQQELQALLARYGQTYEP